MPHGFNVPGAFSERGVASPRTTGYARERSRRFASRYPGCGRGKKAAGDTVSADIEQFYRTRARETPDAIIYADAPGLIAFWNKAAKRMFGFSEAEAVGQSLCIIIPESLRQRHWGGFAQTMRTGKTRYGAGNVLAVTALRKDGARISIEFTILPFADEVGRILGMAAILRCVIPAMSVHGFMVENLSKKSSAVRLEFMAIYQVGADVLSFPKYAVDRDANPLFVPALPSRPARNSPGAGAPCAPIVRMPARLAFAAQSPIRPTTPSHRPRPPYHRHDSDVRAVPARRSRADPPAPATCSAH